MKRLGTLQGLPQSSKRLVSKSLTLRENNHIENYLNVSTTPKMPRYGILCLNT